MALEERAYATLFVSSSEKMNHSIQPLLTAAHCEPVLFAGSLPVAKRLTAERTFDMVILNAPVPSEQATKLACDVSSGETTVCLLFTKAEYYADVRSKVAPCGVFTLSLPCSATTVAGGLEFLSSARERLRTFEKKTVSLQDKMEEIRLVNRAKWLLIERGGLNEPDAHRAIEKKAMDTRTSRREVAEEIIKNYSYAE